MSLGFKRLMNFKITSRCERM